MRILSKASLRAHLIAAIILITLPLLALIWHGAQRQFVRESEALEQEVQRLTTFITGDVNHLMENTRQMLIMAANISRTTSPEQRNAILAELANSCPYYSKFVVVIPTGETYRTASLGRVPAETIDEGLLKAATASKKLVVGRFDASGSGSSFGGKGMLCVAYYVAGGIDTNRSAVSFVWLDLGWLDALLAENRVTGEQSLFPRDMVLNILDRSGTVLTRQPDTAKWIGKRFPDSLVFNEIIKKGEGLADLVGVSGVRRLYAFNSVKAVSGDIIVSIGVSRETALAAAKSDMHRSMLGVSLVGIVLIFAVWFGTGVFIASPVSVLVKATQRLGAGDLATRTGLTSGPQEITHLAAAFDRMAETLQQDAHEREALQAKLVAYDRQLRSMAVETALAEEQDRRQVAAGLHDKAGPLLATCFMKLGRALKLPAPQGVTTAIEESRELIDQTIGELRSLTFDLSSPALYTLGLPAAVDELCRDMGKYHALDISCHDQGTPQDLSSDERVVLYRAARELLINVAKHAEATRVTVTCGGDAEEVFISVVDDGVGFDAAEAGYGFSRTGGFGLFNLRERMKHLGGRFTVNSSRGAGTRATVALPVRCGDDKKEQANGDPGISG